MGLALFFVPLGSLLQEIIVAYLYTKWSIVAKSFVSKSTQPSV